MALRRSSYLNKKQLKEECWTDRLIEEFLGEPDRKSGRECLYGILRVTRVEANADDLRVELQYRRARQDEVRRTHEAQVALISSQFPGISVAFIEEALADRCQFYQPAELGYLRGRATKDYWESLGFRPAHDCIGYATINEELAPVFSTGQLRETETDLQPSDVWQTFCGRYGSEDVATAELLKVANRLQKVNRQAEVYRLKDRWITANQDSLTEGRIARREAKDCWSCMGSGKSDWEGKCWSCEGTGVFSYRYLYEHWFDIAGRTYCFHSYQNPVRISKTPGADLECYGHEFSETELPLPPQSVIVAALRIGMATMWPSATGECRAAAFSYPILSVLQDS